MTSVKIDLQFSAHRSPRTPQFQSWQTGPFCVIFRRKNQQTSTITLADALNKAYKSVAQVKQCSLGKTTVTFTDQAEATHVLYNPQFTEEHHVHVPRNEVEVSGKIVDGGIDLSDLRRNGVGKFEEKGLHNLPIIECCTLSRYSHEEEKYVPTDGIRVTFPGNILPDFVKLRSVWYPVRLFVPKQMYCKQCTKFGHTAKFCRQRSQQHTEDNKMCRYCKVAHTRMETCPVYKARALETGTRYKIAAQQKYQQVSTLYRRPKYMVNVPTTTTTTIVDRGAVRNTSQHVPAAPAVAAAIASAAAARTITTRPAAKQLAAKRSTDEMNRREPPKPGNTKTNCLPNTLPAWILSLCDSLDVQQEWRGFIFAVMPVLQMIWDQLILKYPFLNIFVSSEQ